MRSVSQGSYHSSRSLNLDISNCAEEDGPIQGPGLRWVMTIHDPPSRRGALPNSCSAMTALLQVWHRWRGLKREWMLECLLHKSNCRLLAPSKYIIEDCPRSDPKVEVCFLHTNRVTHHLYSSSYLVYQDLQTTSRSQLHHPPYKAS
jgi:hypothetical protein